ncbi:ras-related GTP-binding protein D isoform X1 [Sapajus apella]|uniref:Ras-related GTP-binding protein n=1 Tax=Sapajus apella TaxID=9515 RepID=A0A6J3HM36_SAPAP|nr:ras-related GTP-binding protein D isoform X1 [Sapajus apella]
MSWLKKGTGGSVTGRVVGSCGCQSVPASTREGSWGRPGGGWGDPPGGCSPSCFGSRRVAAGFPGSTQTPLSGHLICTPLSPPGLGSACKRVSARRVLDFSDPFSTEVKPRILLMGLRRSGKSSIQKVVFHKMSPNETLFLESTNKICREDVSNSSFVNFQIWDFPGQIDFFDPTFDYEMIFRGTGALIFVIDSQDDYMEALARLHLTVTRAYKVNTDINFEVFIHKVDGLSDDHKIETQRDIHQRANDDLADAGLEKIHLSFYLTSIYDHSIFEAFSKVVQKLIPQLPTLENLLNIFISNSGIEKAFLFDVVSKIYIATDSTPVDMQTYELCCDMIDVVIDISCIYGLKEDGAGTPYDKESTAIIKLNNTTVLYLKEVTKFLALVCFVREESFERKGLIDYNFHCFRKAIHEVFEVRMKVVKSRKVQNRLQKKKGATPNGTPRVLL